MRRGWRMIPAGPVHPDGYPPPFGLSRSLMEKRPSPTDFQGEPLEPIGRRYYIRGILHCQPGDRRNSRTPSTSSDGSKDPEGHEGSGFWDQIGTHRNRASHFERILREENHGTPESLALPRRICYRYRGSGQQSARRRAGPGRAPEVFLPRRLLPGVQGQGIGGCRTPYGAHSGRKGDPGRTPAGRLSALLPNRRLWGCGDRATSQAQADAPPAG